MTSPNDLIGSLTAAVNAYTTAQEAMIEASRVLAAESPAPESVEEPPIREDGNGGVPA